MAPAGANKRWLQPLIQLTLIGILSSSFVAPMDVSVPRRCKTEGRLTLNYPSEDQAIYKYHLAFTESLDADGLRSVISIGYVGYDPVKYYTRRDSPTITVDSNGVCQPLERAANFVNEINWFVQKFLGIQSNQFNAEYPFLVGPTGMFALVNTISSTSSSTDFKYDRATTYRNIACKIYSRTIRVPNKSDTIRVELYSPAQGTLFRNLQDTYFSIHVTILNDGSDGGEDVKPNYVIDYYNIENFDNDPEKFDRMLKEDFNLPTSKGCSKYLTEITPKSGSQLSLNFKQTSNAESYLLAYDQSAGYLRKELIGKSVSIWDLNEELLYHVAEDVPVQLETQFTKGGSAQTCSVLHVSDEKLGPNYRPYAKANEPLDVLKLLGASKLAYMGRGSVRDLPCRIYETIIDRPPVIFGVQNEPDLIKSVAPGAPGSLVVDYIVQFYLLQGQQDMTKSDVREELQTNIDFWPAKIVLSIRIESLAIVELVDQLDVYDFYWSLDGWDKKASQLFMASECFDDDDEQLRLEMALTFDKVHKGAVSADDKALLPFNKFKLEFELINDLFSLFQISKLHLVEYELKLSPNHVNLDLVIGDRRDYKNLVFVGEGRLPSEDSYQSNRVVQFGLSEDACVMLSSLINDISMVVFCPNVETGSQCTAVYDESTPVVEYNQPGNQQAPACHVYWYTSAGVPQRGTEIVLQKSASLHRHPFEFVASKLDKLTSVTLNGEIKHYDISREMQLISIDNYMFALDDDLNDKDPNRNVRSINTVTYKIEADCARMCNLDVTCRSYSYCSSSTNHPCILSRLDLRASDAREQLIHSTGSMKPGSRVTIKGVDNTDYVFQLADKCEIYERDYLNMFRQTDEIIRLDASIASQFPQVSTTFECAKQSVDLESEAVKKHDHHIAMFAYCATLNVCLMDQNLFTVTMSGDSPKNNEQDELLCRLYRKKYQTYFKVSPEVMPIEPEKQVELSGFNTVEECAKACWVKFGQVCASFDYCSPRTCLINQIGDQSTDEEVKSEIRSNCLHYERDLELEELRKRHLNLPGQLLDTRTAKEEPTTFLGWLMNIITYILVFCAFLYGLVLGRQVNDKLDSSPTFSSTSRQSAVPASARPARRETLFGFQRFSTFGRRLTEANLQQERNEELFDPNKAIKLDVINKRASDSNADDEPLEVDF